MRHARLIGLFLLAASLLGFTGATWHLTAAPQTAATEPAPDPTPSAATPVIAPPPPTRSVGDLLDSGIVITISLASQRMHVFRDGVLWRTSPVSTGKRGKATPIGVYAILQKKRFHRSNLYSNAPMPFMQRLTWDGIAIHAGHLPGYPASHGCIRIPSAFAAELFAITSMASTAVIVVAEALPDETVALALAQRTDRVVPIVPELLQREALARTQPEPASTERLPAVRTIAAPVPGEVLPTAAPKPTGRAQTIQLAAAISAGSAKAEWYALAARRPELRGMQMAIIPALVNGTRYYRLRATAPDAHAKCAALKRAGIACFPIS